MSSPRSRSGGRWIGNDVDAIEEVLAEPAVGHHLREILVGRRDDAHRRLELFDAAEPAELPLLQHAQELHLHHRVHLADFVEKQRALLRRLDEPLLVDAGARERALHVAEQLGFEQRLGQRAAVQRDERPIAPQRVEMDGPRHPFLACARLAGDEHGAVGPRDLLDQLEDREHLLAAPDDIGELMAGPERALQQHVLLPELPLLERVADFDLQLVDVERLAEVVVGAQPHRLDGGVGRRERGNHDAEHVLIDALGGAQHVDAAHVGHLDVGDQQVEAAALELVDRHAGRFRRASRRTPRAAARSTAARASIARRPRRAVAPARRGFLVPVRPFPSSAFSSSLFSDTIDVIAPSRPRRLVTGSRTLTVVPSPGRRAHMNLAAVVADDAVDDRQPEARAFREVAAERLKDRVELVGRNPHALVGHLEHDRIPAALAFRFDAARRASAGRRCASRAGRWWRDSRRSA